MSDRASDNPVPDVPEVADIAAALATIGAGGSDDALVALATSRETSFAPQSNASFVEPWLRRVRDVDDDTMAGLLQQLIGLRRLRNVVAGVCCAVGMGVFGTLGGLPTVYLAIMYGVLAATVGFPVFAIGSLSVRRLFLREATAQGLSRAAAMLVLTRAERRARLLAPWVATDVKVDALLKAVRDPDEA